LFDETTGETYYLTRLRIPEAELAKLENLKLVPGMPVETFIDTGERTALSYLLKPFADGLARALRDD
jgi:HlyD family secretion protein